LRYTHEGCASFSKDVLIQEYFESLLYQERKVDLRYFLFTHRGEWFYFPGYARVACHKYRAQTRQAHLTNVYISKDDEYCKVENSIARVEEYLNGNDVSNSIEELLSHVVLRIDSIITSNEHRFAIFGIDLLITPNLRPYLLEINLSPTLAPATDIDRKVKYELLRSVMSHILEQRSPVPFDETFRLRQIKIEADW